MIKKLSWDSSFFDLKVGEYYFRESRDNIFLIREEIKKLNFDLVYLYSNSLLSILDFYDEKVVFIKDRMLYQPLCDDNINSIKNTILTDKLSKLAIRSGLYSRFNLDPQFPHSLFEKLYVKWIENSIAAEFATEVLCFSFDGDPIGLLTYKVNNNIAKIGIIAIDEKMRNKGIGSKLLTYFESNLPINIIKIEVSTQGKNLRAQSFYEKNGYKEISRAFIYHLWK